MARSLTLSLDFAPNNSPETVSNELPGPLELLCPKVQRDRGAWKFAHPCPSPASWAILGAPSRSGWAWTSPAVTPVFDLWCYPMRLPQTPSYFLVEALPC